MEVDVPAEDRVAVFIDGSNFYFALKAAGRTRQIDFSHMVSKLVGTRSLVRVYYYNAPVKQADVPDQYRRQQAFFDSLRNLDYFEIRLGRLVRRPDGRMMEKGVDVRLAVDMVAFAGGDRYDTAVLVSADGDFAEAVQLVKNMGKHVEVAYPSPGGRQLRQYCDKFILLDDDYLIAPR